jgi:O-methyltransferase involved in polyketide biosynthesis
MKEKEPKQEHCDCKRAYKEALSGICELCWDEKYPTKQETLEEAAENHAKIFQFPFDCDPAETFIEGAKWQQERMYSEEEVYDILFKHTEYFLGGGERMSLTQWFEQFKKK